jgi:hypothetical protein
VFHRENPEVNRKTCLLPQHKFRLTAKIMLSRQDCDEPGFPLRQLLGGCVKLNPIIFSNAKLFPIIL